MQTSRNAALLFWAAAVVMVAVTYLLFGQDRQSSVPEPSLELHQEEFGQDAGDAESSRRLVVAGELLSSEEDAGKATENKSGELAPPVDSRKLAFFDSHDALQQGELRGIWTATKAVHDELRDELYESEKTLGLYQEVVFEYDPNSRVQIPRPADLPTASYIQQVISPGEGQGVEGVGVVWYVTLTKDEYPDLYQLRDELKWLSELIGK